MKLDKKLQKKIDAEIKNIERLFCESKPLFDLCKVKTPDFIEASAVSLTLHSFYNGIENILLLIGKSIDENIPHGQEWHTTLFNNAFMANSNRTNIFREEIKMELREYLTFRHFIRHAYNYTIDNVKLKPLVENVESVWIKIKEDLNIFYEKNQYETQIY
ncbi:MAG: hypothetical protein LBE12_07465 [Planctomycetaceae bacterium]|nr:hypothetical protein [Planctomycetaceae bacterium]